MARGASDQAAQVVCAVSAEQGRPADGAQLVRARWNSSDSQCGASDPHAISSPERNRIWQQSRPRALISTACRRRRSALQRATRGSMLLRRRRILRRRMAVLRRRRGRTRRARATTTPRSSRASCSRPARSRSAFRDACRGVGRNVERFGGLWWKALVFSGRVVPKTPNVL